MTLLGSKGFIDAQEALRLGIISELVPQDELSERAIQIATDIASNSPAAVRASLRNLWSSIDLPTGEAVACALSATNLWRNHPDAVEGRNAHAEGRPARWVDEE
jgi:enoyl-CoA hydratase/carnithine racemase